MDIALAKGLRVLELLANAGGPMRVSSIAQELALPKSGVHRLLGTLCDLGFAAQDEQTRLYSARLRTWELGAAILGVHPLKTAAGPVMLELHRQLHETVNLLVREDDDMLFLDKILSPRPQRFTTQPGMRRPMLSTASGLVVLAHEPDAAMVVDRIIKTVTSAKDLDARKIMKEVAKAGHNGYAISESRWTPGIVGIAAPIIGRDGRAVGTLAVSGPDGRIGGDRRQDIVGATIDACGRIGRALT